MLLIKDNWCCRRIEIKTCITEKGCATLTIEEDSHCELLSYTYWETIIVEDNVCNDITTTISIANYPNLKSITIGENSFNQLTMLQLERKI